MKPVGVIAAVAAAIAVFPIILVLFFMGASPAVNCEPSQVSGTVAGIPDSAAGFDKEQLSNAAEIVRAGAAQGLDSRDQTIGIMTAIGESTLRVLDYGDAVGPDSRGLFQQRSNGAWGTYEDRMNPYTSATSFFRVLKTIEGRDLLEPTLVAHRVQRNANPQHYARHWNQAQEIFTALTNQTPNPASNEVAGAASVRYQLGAVKPHVAAVADSLGRMFNVKTIGGWRAGNTYDYEGHPAGLALDLMTDSTAHGTQIADYARTNATALGIKYLIWNQRIWSLDRDAEGWRPMADRGSISANHKDHVHASFNPEAGTGSLSNGAAPLPPECGPGSAQPPLPGVPGAWVSPAAGPITSSYGTRKHPITGIVKLHSGTDLGGGGCDAPIYAAKAGVVVSADKASGYGHLITIDHGDGVQSRYAHMYASGIMVAPGQQIASGQQIGRVGSDGYSTGCHLHFEIKINGSFTDPYTYLAAQSLTLG